jgi:hypothetical protein
MVWMRQTLMTGESDRENAAGHKVEMRVAGHFAAGSLGNRIKHIVCDLFSCGKPEIDEKIVPAVLNICFSGAKVTFG